MQRFVDWMKGTAMTAILVVALCSQVAGLRGNALAAHFDETAQQTISPYFFVQSDDPGLDSMPLKSTAVEATISGVIANVKVVQVYCNEGERALDAIYVFPASTRASVYGMTMTVGDRVITAKVQEREEAQKIFEKARSEGRGASILEQKRPNVFQMSVANILPGDEVRVELRYVEVLAPAGSVYEFVYPTVVAPRYAGKTDEVSESETWVQAPYLPEGGDPGDTFDIQVHIAADISFQAVACRSHKVKMSFGSEESIAVTLDPSERSGGNRDYVLQYQLAGRSVQTGILLHEGEEENFFLLMVEPPEKGTPAPMPPREYIFVVDVSGSMHGFPLEISKRLLGDLLGGLRPVDRFNVVLFSGSSSVLSEGSLEVTEERLAKALGMIKRQEGAGGTELLPALERALAFPRVEGASRTVILVTDGYVRVEKEVFEFVRKNLGEANVFAFGIGSAVNRYLMEGVARAGMGEVFIVTDEAQAGETAERFRQYVASPLLTGVTVDFGDFGAYDVEPPNIPDLLASRPLMVFGKWRGEPEGTIRISGKTGEGEYAAQVDVSKATLSESHNALAYLWARHRIGLLADGARFIHEDEQVREITQLGLRYNLLTAHTSFVAEDAVVRLVDGVSTKVVQPLPLPMGVSGFALGALGMPARDGVGVKGFVLGGGEMRIRVQKTEIQGELSKEAIEGLIEEYAEELKACLRQRNNAVTPGTPLIAILTVVLDGEGKISKVSWDLPLALSDSTKQNLMNAVKAWPFPAPADARSATVRYTLEIS